MLLLLTCWVGQDFLLKQNILLMDYLRIHKHCLVLVAFMVIQRWEYIAAPKIPAPYILLSTIYFLLKGDGKREQGLLRE